MTSFKTLALTLTFALMGATAAFADGMASDAMMKKDAAAMKACQAMGAKAKTDAKCVALMKKHDAMKADAMKADPMKGDAMHGDSMMAEHH